MARNDYTFPEEVTLIYRNPDTGAESRHVSYAEVRSVFAREVYAAMAVGLRPDFMIVLPSWSDDYHGEQTLIYGDAEYRIERAYKTDDLMAELTVTRLRLVRSDSDTE